MTSSFSEDVGKRYHVGQYQVEIRKVIAEGGYGVVFVVADHRGQEYALKRFYVNDQQRLRECQTEIEIMDFLAQQKSSLSGYEHIIKYIDSSVRRRPEDGVYEILILMEYCPVSVIARLRRGVVLSEVDILHIFCDLCEAVAVLHHCQLPVTHRDIKIENILQTRRSKYVLCDFGSATREEYNVNTSDTQSVLRLQEHLNQHTTPSHRPPEVVNLYSNKLINTKVDIWAMGVTLFRLCFQLLPFGEGSLSSDSSPLCIPQNCQYSDNIKGLIYYCLTVDPEQRPDIYQVSAVTFQIARKPCPVPNRDGVSVLSPQDVIQLMEARINSTNVSTSRSAARINTDWVETTTINPRERPKGHSHTHSSSPIDLSMLQHQNDLAAQQISSNVIQKKTTSLPCTERLIDLNPHTNTSTTSLPAGRTDNPFGDDFSQFDFLSLRQRSENGANSAQSNIFRDTTQNDIKPHAQQSSSMFLRGNASPFGDDFSSYKPEQLTQFGCSTGFNTTSSLQSNTTSSMLDPFGAQPFNSNPTSAMDTNLLWS